MPDKRDVILQEMSEIYIMFCLPRITINTETHETKIEYVWQDDKVQQTFETLGEMLRTENLALLEQQYAQRSVQWIGLEPGVHKVQCEHCCEITEFEVPNRPTTNAVR